MGLERQRQLARHVQGVTRIPRHADAQLFVELGQIRVDLYQLEKVVGINDAGQG